MTPFHLFSTAGNTTLFLEGAPGSLREAMNIIPCEQAALADVREARAVMAGGEFCVNACLAFAALLRLNGEESPVMRMVDQSVSLCISGAAPGWCVQATFPASMVSATCTGGKNLARLPGIVHALVEVDRGTSFPEDAIKQARRLWAAMDLDNEPASGLVWWRKVDSGFEILPVVQVPQAGTCNVEGACGSASLALAMLLPEGEYSVAQPSGSVLTVRRSGASLALAGPVRLLARGELCLS